MEQQANHLLQVLKNRTSSREIVQELLSKFKSHIKNHHVPEAAAPFEVARLAIADSTFAVAGFSILSCLIRRLELQDQQSVIAAQGIKTYPVLVDRLAAGLGTESHTANAQIAPRAIQALGEFWRISHVDVESYLRDKALSSKNPKAKEVSIQWIVRMNQESGLQIKSFVPKIVNCLEDADPGVRDVAKAAIIDLFHGLPDTAKSDLKKLLQQRNVRKKTVMQINSQLGLPADADTSSTFPDGTPKKDTIPSGSINGEYAPPKPAPSASELEAEQLQAIHVHSHRELEEIFREMHPLFEGKESEQNWSPREKSIIKLRRIAKGNTPHDLAPTFLAAVKANLDGILKTVNSLRTTVSTNGCHLLQDIARNFGPGLDPMVEILLQNLIKLCGGTKTINAQNGNATVDAIFSHVSYNVRLMQHIWNACQDKNVRPRSYATGWLKTLITKHGHHKHVLEHANGLELIEKCIKKGLDDANKDVRDGVRSTYWAFWRVWLDRAESLMGSLEEVKQGQLLRDPSNPDPSKAIIPPTASTGTKPVLFSRSTTSALIRPSIKDVIAARKKQEKAAAALERPGSAQASVSPTRPNITRPATSMAMAQMGTLSSAPLRPKLAKPKPSSSLNKRAETPNGSPVKAAPPPPRKGGYSPTTRALEELTMVIPSMKATTPQQQQQGRSRAATDDLCRDLASLKAAASPHSTPIPSAAPPVTLLSDDFQLSSPPPPRPFITSTVRLAAAAEDLSGGGRDGAPRRESVPPIYRETPDSVGSERSNDGLHHRVTAVGSPVRESGRPVLGELPINPETVSPHREGGASSAGGAMKAHHGHAGPSKLIDSGIHRIRGQTLDVHGFRKLQSLIVAHRVDEGWWREDGGRFGELVEVLLGSLLSTSEDAIKMQTVFTMQVLVKCRAGLFLPFCARVLCVMLRARSRYGNHSHFVAGLDELAEGVVSLTDRVGGCVEAVVDCLTGMGTGEEVEVEVVSGGMLAGGFELLTSLLQRAGKGDHRLGVVGQRRVAELAVGQMEVAEVEMRKASMDCAIALWGAMGDEAGFWGLMGGRIGCNTRNMLTYRIARAARLS